MSYVIREQQRRRSACASAQSDQRLCCSLLRQNNISRFYSRNFKTRYCGCADLFVTYEPSHEKTCLMLYANNKGADQPAHPRSLISAFVVRCLDRIISLDSIAEISRLGTVAAQTGFCLAWSETPDDTFCHDEAHIKIKNCIPIRAMKTFIRKKMGHTT